MNNTLFSLPTNLDNLGFASLQYPFLAKKEWNFIKYSTLLLEFINIILKPNPLSLFSMYELLNKDPTIIDKTSILWGPILSVDFNSFEKKNLFWIQI